ncbi:unnamed protein product [Symbiodinium sp. CCMP2456]|nr:unnamed protein product [Symbiodinium sp. CCMP2456]
MTGSLQFQNKVHTDCSSAAKEWPQCTMSSHCNEPIKNGALTGVSLEGKQLPCSTTPISTSGVYKTGWIDLKGAKYEVTCPEGMLLSTLDHSYNPATKQGLFFYSCVRATALGSCQNVAFSTEGLEVQCPEEAALQSFVLKKSSSGSWSISPRCCYAASLVLGLRRSPLKDPDQIADRLQSWEGVYCPSLRDESGRLQYLQRSSFKNPRANFSQSVDESRSLSFDLTFGQWCLAGVCAASDAADPIDEGSRPLLAETWEAVAVTDFDGRFGTPTPTTGATKGKRKKPTLVKFHALVPNVPVECKETVPDWDTVGKTLSKENPCYYVTGKAAHQDPHSDVFDTWGAEGYAQWWESTKWSAEGQDFNMGGRGGAGFSYEHIVGCWDREGKRSGHLKSRERDVSEGKDTITAFFNGPVGLACLFAPDDAAAPLGIGAIIKTSKICDGVIKKSVEEVYSGIEWMTDQYEANSDKESDADCSGDHAAIQRIWCDLHCVREAVEEGTTAILGSLKEAVNVLDTNFDRLMQYYTGLAGDKVDALAGPKKLSAAEVKKSLLVKLGQVHRLVSAPLDQVGNVASQNLLETFLQDLHNRSSAAEVVEDVEQLHASMLHIARRSKLSASAAVAANVGRAAVSMQELARSRSHLLGVYSHHGRVSRQRQQRLAAVAQSESDRQLLEGGDAVGSAKSLGGEVWQVLLQLDSTWWALRAAFDKYLEKAKDYSSTYTSSAKLLQDYVDCAAQFGPVREAYGLLVQAEANANKALHEAWSEMVPLAGLLVSKLVDSNSLVKLSLHDVQLLLEPSLPVQQWPRLCDAGLDAAVGSAVNRSLDEGLTGQTMQQLATMFSELMLLKSRANKRLENLDVLEDSLERAREHMTQSFAARLLLHERMAKQVRTKFCEPAQGV